MKRSLYTILLLLLCAALHSQISYAPLEAIKEKGRLGPNHAELDVQYARLNDDEHRDMMFLAGAGLFIKHGLGDGTFAEEIQVFEAEEELVSMSEMEDLDGDGDLDMLVTTDDQFIRLAWNDGVFTEVARSDGGNRTSVRIKWYDYNQDGQLDMLTSNTEGLLVNYNWRQQLDDFETIIGGNETWPSNFWFVDINNDGLDDLVLPNVYNFRIYLRTAQGNWNLNYENDERIGAPSLGDVNMDGHTDIVYEYENDIYVLYYQPTIGRFDLVNETEDFYMVNVSRQSLVDLDNNGSLDVVFTHAQGRVAYMKNEGGVLSDPITLINNGIGGINAQIQLDDLNKDGNTDLLLHSLSLLDVVLMGGDASVADYYTTGLRKITRNIDMHDMDGDGWGDIVQGYLHGEVNIMWGDEELSFTEELSIDAPKWITYMGVVDLDEDALLDIVFTLEVPGTGTDSIYFVKNLGDRQFEPPVVWRYMPDANPFILADLDNDDTEELIFYSGVQDAIVWYSRELDDHNEFYQSQHTTRLNIDGFIRNISKGDMNNDGLTDLVVSTTKELMILRNNGFKQFITWKIPSLENTSGAGLMDYNFDGKIDVLVASGLGQDQKMHIYLGDGLGNFARQEESFDLDTFRGKHFQFFDIDLDGDQDILVHSSDYTVTNTFENYEGTFYPYPGPSLRDIGQSQRAYGYLNQDEKIDAVTVHLGNEDLFYQLNNSVLPPSLEGFDVKAFPEYDKIYVNIDFPNNNGSFILIKEGADQRINRAPQDGTYYSYNSTLGAGDAEDEFDGGQIVHVSNANSIRIENAKPLTDYTIFAFPFNVNLPNQGIIRYSEDHLKINVTTPSSIEEVQEFESLTLNEEQSVNLDLEDYLTVHGEGQFEVSADTSGVQLTLDEGRLNLTGALNFHGSATVTIVASNEWESKEFSFEAVFQPVNDVPNILQLSDLLRSLNPFEQQLAISDVETPLEDLIIEVRTSDVSVVPQENLSWSVMNERVVLSVEPIAFGVTTLTVTASDGEATSEMTFDLTIGRIVSTDPVQASNKIRVYPNPASDELVIELNNRAQVMRLYDLNGHQIRKLMQVPERLSIKTLEPGLYFINIAGQVLRFIKQ